MMTISEIKDSCSRIEPYIFKTPILHSVYIDTLVGAKVSFKPESLQVSGSFKARGAFNALLRLTEQEKARGVVAYSSGNHGKALAYAGHLLNIPVTLVLSKNISSQKLKSIQHYGARIRYYDPKKESRVEVANKIEQSERQIMIPPYEHEHVIAGQGTVGLELLEQLGDDLADSIFVPVGGGGLIAGIATAAKAFYPAIKVYGVEPKFANDQQISFRNKSRVRLEDSEISTICEGLRTNEPGELAFPYILKNVDDIVTATDESVRIAMELMWNELKLVVEPAGALTLAFLLENKPLMKNYQHVAVVVCGGNISFTDYLAVSK